MIPLYSTSQIRDFDSHAINKLQVPGIVLMENAALGIYQAILERLDNTVKSIGFICGKGNNGGDGFAVARHFSNAGFSVKVVSIGNETGFSKDCKTNYIILKNLSAKRKNISIKPYKSIKDISLLRNCDVLIDAMLGSGFTGDLKEPYSLIIKAVNKINKSKCAIDVPTGLNANTGYGNTIFNSDLTITLGNFKKGLFISNGYEYCGEVLMHEIGVGSDFFDSIETEEFLIEPEDAYLNLPVRKKSVHKYSAGKVLTIAGSYKYPGAAVLSSKSSLIAGAGSSILAIPQSAKKLISKDLLEVVVESYGTDTTKSFNEEALNSLETKIKWADVVSIGPGLGREDCSIKAVQKFLLVRKYKFAVIDADALFALNESFIKKISLKNCILTPHLGEFSNLIGVEKEVIEKDILSFGREFAIKNKCILVLKGAPSIIFNSFGGTFINTSGNSGMAKFGSGDVLTGIIAGLLAQNKMPLSAAISGVYLHSLSADLVANEKSINNYLASDIMKKYSNAIKFVGNSIV